MGTCASVDKGINHNTETSTKLFDLAKDCIIRAKEFITEKQINEAISTYSTVVIFLRDAGIEKPAVKELLIQSYLEQAELYIDELNSLCAEDCYREAKKLGSETAKIKLQELSKRFKEAERTPSAVPTIIIGDLGTESQIQDFSVRSSPKGPYGFNITNTGVLSTTWTPRTSLPTSQRNNSSSLLLHNNLLITNSPRTPRNSSPRTPRDNSPRTPRDNSPRTPRDTSRKYSLPTARSASIFSNVSLNHKNIPLGFPTPPGGLEQVWDFKANLHYSVDWIDKGTYKLHILQPNQEDFNFVESLYRLHPITNYEVAEVSLIHNTTKEQIFVAGLDLLDKKHGNSVHQPKWKLGRCAIRLSNQENNDFPAIKRGEEIVILKNSGCLKVIYKKKNYDKIESFILQQLPNIDLELLIILETLTFDNNVLSKECGYDVERICNFIYQEVKAQQGQVYIYNAGNKITRNYLTELRYRSSDVQHVKLLSLWQGVTENSIKELKEREFEDLTYSTDLLLGKGYYGVSSAEVAYTIAKQKAPKEQILLMISWCSGKVIYPVANGDQPDCNWWIQLTNQEPTNFTEIQNGKSVVVIKEFDPVTLNDQFKIIYSLKIDHNLIKSCIVTTADKDFPERLTSKELEFNGNVLSRYFINEKIYEYIYKTVSANNGYIQPLLLGGPHYANYDMHFAPIDNNFNVAKSTDKNNHYQAAMFDSSQILPRYLVTLARSGTMSEPRGSSSESCEMKCLIDQMLYNKPGNMSFIFKPDFFYSIGVIYKKSLESINQQLTEINDLCKTCGSGNLDVVPSNITEDCDIFEHYDNVAVDNIINIFLHDQSKEVLCLATNSILEQRILVHYIEITKWNDYRDGKPIPLYIFLPNVNNANLSEHLVEDYLMAKGLSIEEILDLKEHKNWLFILGGYEELAHKSALIKSNGFNRLNGFKGKILVIDQKKSLSDDADVFFYTKGGTIEQQRTRYDKKYIKITPTEFQQKIYTALQQGSPIRLPSEIYEKACESYNPTLATPGGLLKPWEYDSKLRYSVNWINKGVYKIHPLQPGDPDYDFVAKLYQKTPVSNYEIDKLYLISDQAAELAFSANLALLSHRSNNTEYQPHWLQENNSSLRTRVKKTFDDQSYTSILTPGVQIIPLWHGTGPNQATGIATAGFASLAIVDSGYFGKGLYGSYNAEYAYRVYASGYNKGNEVLLLSWYATQNTYPVISGDLEKLKGHANYQNYDSHFILVTPENQTKHEQGIEDTYLPINEQQTAVYEELVTFQTAQVLPRYILSLKEIGTENHSGGITKFLSAPSINPSNRLKLYQKDVAWAIAALQHMAQLECEQNIILTQGLSLYVLAEASDSNEPSNNNQDYCLQEKAEFFLQDPSKEIWILEGNSGSGKSLFGRYLEQILWDKYLDGAPIPIFISLPLLGDLNQVTDLIEKALMLKGIPNKVILELKRKKKFLFIFDNYSALPNKLPLIKKYKFNEPHQWRGKIILLHKTNHITTEDVHLLDPDHPGKNFAENANLCQRSFLLPFTNDQILDYIEEFCCSEFNTSGWGFEQYQEAIDASLEIKEFLKEPFLLYLVLNTLPKLYKDSHNKITVIKLYKMFMNIWFNNQFELLVENNFDLSKYQNPKEEILSIAEQYATNLAYSMFLQDTYIIENLAEDLTEDISIGFNCCPVKKYGCFYSFVHNLFREYFVAEAILNDLKTLNLEYNFLLHSKLQQKKITNNTTILSLISEPLMNNANITTKRLEKHLFNIMLLSKEHPELRIAAINAASILNAACISFSYKDCSGLSLSEANFSYGIFHHTNFENSDLSNANFYCAWLADTNLIKTIMQGVVFGERAFLKVSNPVHACAYSPDDHYFAVASNKLIIIHEAKTLQEIKNLTKHNSIVNAIAFDASGIKLVSGDVDGMVLVWELKQFRCTHVFSGHVGAVNSVIFNKDGNHIISCSQDQSICLWDLRQKKHSLIDFKNITYKHIFTGHTNSVNMIAISPNENYLASGSSDRTVCLWDYEHLCHKYTFKKHTTEVSCVAFSPLGELLASGSHDQTICLWDYKFFCHKYTFIGHNGIITSIVFSPVGDILASGSTDQTIRFWDMSKLSFKHAFTSHNKAPIYGITFNAVGNQLAGSSLTSIVNFWDLNQSYYKRTFPGHTKPVSSVAFSPVNKQLISGSYDTTICLWDLQCFYNKHIFEGHTNIVSNVAFNSRGDRLVSGSWDKTIRLWNIFDFCYDDFSQFGYQHNLTWPANDFVTSVSFNPTGDQVAFGGGDSTVKILELAQLCQKSTFKGHTNLVSSVAYSPDGEQLISGSFDKTVRLWDLRQPKNKYNFIGHTGGVNSITISPAGNYVASASDDTTIRIWDLEEWCCKYILKGHTKAVQCVAFTPDGCKLASGGHDNTIRVWDLCSIDEQNKEAAIDGKGKTIQNSMVVKTNGPILSVVWYELLHELFLASGGEDAAIRLWKIEQEKIFLTKSSCQNTLYADNANVDGSMLSLYNIRLLKQKGAINEPTTIDRLIEPTSSKSSDNTLLDETLSGAISSRLQLS